MSPTVVLQCRPLTFTDENSHSIARANERSSFSLVGLSLEHTLGACSSYQAQPRGGAHQTVPTAKAGRCSVLVICLGGFLRSFPSPFLHVTGAVAIAILLWRVHTQDREGHCTLRRGCRRGDSKSLMHGIAFLDFPLSSSYPKASVLPPLASPVPALGLRLVVRAVIVDIQSRSR